MGTQEPARVRIAWWDRAAITGLGAAGAALSFDALQQMAAAIHVRQELVWLFPLVIDGFIAYGVRALVVLRDTSFAARLYVWTLFAAATATSIWANGLHAVRLNQQTPGQAGLHLGDLTVGVLSTAAPLALAGAVHLYILIARRAATTIPTADGYPHHAGTTTDGPAAAVPGTAGDGPALTVAGTAGDGSPSPSRPSRRPADVAFPHPGTSPAPPPPAGPGPLPGPVADEPWAVRPHRTDPSPAPGGPAHLSALTSADTAADRPGTALTPPVPQPSPVRSEGRSGTAGGSDIPASASSRAGDGPVPDPSAGPSRSEGRSGDSSGMAQQQGEVDHLLPLARDAVQQARHISRDVVRSALREHGIQISNRRLGALLRALRNEAAPATTTPRSVRD